MLTIAWDVDDVLNELMRTWFEKKWLKKYPHTLLTYADLKENPPHRILQIREEEYLDSLDKFRLSGQYAKMKPRSEVKQWFSVNGWKFRHIALTATPLSSAPITAEWVFSNFGKWIRTFHVVPSYRKKENIPIYDKDKKDFLEWLGKVDILIDDNEVNLNTIISPSVHKILFPCPWNRNSLSIEETLQLIK